MLACASMTGRIFFHARILTLWKPLRKQEKNIREKLDLNAAVTISINSSILSPPTRQILSILIQNKIFDKYNYRNIII